LQVEGAVLTVHAVLQAAMAVIPPEIKEVQGAVVHIREATQEHRLEVVSSAVLPNALLP
jgi:hypothetical protein